MSPLLVKELIKKLTKESPDAVVIVRAYEDGSCVEDVSNKNPHTEMYWKGNPPTEKGIPTVTIGVLEDHGASCSLATYKKFTT